ncbi:prepilin peptidase [Candidatus Dependentiae bacterium]
MTIKILELLFLAPLFLCWGSFLNMLAHRLINTKKFWAKRSFCPKCKKAIPWYDNIPLLSWIMLKAKCRHCKQTISALYPFIELFTATTMLALYYQLQHTYNLIYFPAYFIFFSALIITIRTDIEFMLISRFATIFLIPLGFLFSFLGLLPINLLSSLLGALLGYGFLFGVSKIFKYLTGKQGIGQGDLELLAFIGSFLGIIGCWISLFLGSIIGSLFGIIYIAITKKSKAVKMPFGHFLSIGAILFVLFGKYLSYLVLGI